MWKRATILCAACALEFGCEKPSARQELHPSDVELAEKYAAWAARQPRPPRDVVNRIEALLAKNPCIGRLDRWSRFYAYHEDMRSATLYPGLIDFHLEEVGRFGVRPGVHITEPNSWLSLDDRPIKMAWGDHEVSTGKLTIGFCANNVGPSPEPTAIVRQDYFDDLKARQMKQRGISTR